MARQLRPRNKKTNYASLATGKDFEQGSSNKQPVSPPATITVTEELSSGESAFSLADSEEEDQLVGDDGAEEDLEEEEEAPPIKTRTRKREAPAPQAVEPSVKTKRKTKAETKATETSSASLPKGAKRQIYSLPVPSVNHRHRAMQIYTREGRVERLVSRPKLFRAPDTTLTNGFTTNSKVVSRVSKSWGYNVGPGPLWELVEDRGWYKEGRLNGADTDTEVQRRPVVYSDLPIPNGWRIINLHEAGIYLPTDDITTEEGNLRPPPPLPCYFGPIQSQTRQDLQMFDAIPLSRYTPESKGYVLNAGAPIWGLDWCPIHRDMRASRSCKQYLAIAPFPSHVHSPDIGRRVMRPSPACIQIWSLSPDPPASESGKLKCEMVLCLDSGPAYELKWCPLPAHDAVNEGRRPRKLGLLGGTFEDGSFSVYAVPFPEDLASPTDGRTEPVYVKLPEPVLRIELEETTCWSFDWANSELIAIGTTNGTIAVYDVGVALKDRNDPNDPTITNFVPTHYLSVHQSAIRALAWIKAPPIGPSGDSRPNDDPTVIASGGYDGMECMTDIREGRGSVMNRTRDVINALTFSPFTGGPITMDHENTVKAYSASPSMLGRGHSLMEPQGPVWSVHCSEYHPQLAVGAADGSCSTTNTLRATRRGGSVPFFVYKIFQMDYNRNTKEYRMLDRFLPQEFLDRTTISRAAKGKAKADDAKLAPSTGAWPREVGVHRVAWNNGNGLESSCLLAAGTASGLCRIDVVWGRWSKDKIPYGGVEGVRMEDEDGMDVDSESEGESD